MSKSIFSEDLTVTGDVSGSGNIEVSGTVKGDIQTQSITILKTGTLEGRIKVDTAQVQGHLKGAITAKTVDFTTTALIEADVTASSMSTEKGARVKGQLSIGE